MHNKRYSIDINSLPPTQASNIISHLTYFKSLLTDNPAAHLSPLQPLLHAITAKAFLQHSSDYIIPCSKTFNSYHLLYRIKPYFLAWHARPFAIWLSPHCHCTQMPGTICSSSSTPNTTCIFMPPSLCSSCSLHIKYLSLFTNWQRNYPPHLLHEAFPDHQLSSTSSAIPSPFCSPLPTIRQHMCLPNILLCMHLPPQVQTLKGVQGLKDRSAEITVGEINSRLLLPACNK